MGLKVPTVNPWQGLNMPWETRGSILSCLIVYLTFGYGFEIWRA